MVLYCNFFSNASINCNFFSKNKNKGGGYFRFGWVLLERLERGLLSLLCCAGVDEGEKKRVYTVVYTRGGGRLVTACAVL